MATISRIVQGHLAHAHEGKNMRRVVVTGLGIVAPTGLCVPEAWERALSGRSAVTKITQFDASGLTTQIAEVVKIVLGRGKLRPVPCYTQFDAYRCLLRRGRLRGGNRHPLERLKRMILRRRMRKLGYRVDP